MKLLSGSNTLGIPLSLFLGNNLKHQNNGGELQSVVYIIQMGLSFPVAIPCSPQVHGSSPCFYGSRTCPTPHLPLDRLTAGVNNVYLQWIHILICNYFRVLGLHNVLLCGFCSRNEEWHNGILKNQS